MAQGTLQVDVLKEKELEIRRQAELSRWTQSKQVESKEANLSWLQKTSKVMRPYLLWLALKMEEGAFRSWIRQERSVLEPLERNVDMSTS